MIIKGDEDRVSKSFYKVARKNTPWDGQVLMFQAIIPGVVIDKIFSKTKDRMLVSIHLYKYREGKKKFKVTHVIF